MNFIGKTLAVFGDSIINGSGNDNFGVGEYLIKDYGFVLLKYCVGGARVGYCKDKNWVAHQVKQALADGINPDYIVFNGFTNDCFRTDGINFDVPIGSLSSAVPDVSELKTTDSFSICFESIVCAFLKYFPSAKIIFVRPHKMGRREDEAQRIYGERAVEICKKYGVAVADVYKDSGLNTFLPEHRDKYTADTYGWGKGDCTHPNAVGYEKFYMPIIEKIITSLSF